MILLCHCCVFLTNEREKGEGTGWGERGCLKGESRHHIWMQQKQGVQEITELVSGWKTQAYRDLVAETETCLFSREAN